MLAPLVYGMKNPKIYHITHIDNLAAIVQSGCLLSDATMSIQGGPVRSIGMSSIKRRRLQLPVSCHPGTTVGEYVPFYFCPRSVMLYVIHRSNHPELAYQDGQEPIIHLEADVHRVITWAQQEKVRWAISSINAGARYAVFWNDVAALHQLDWKAIQATDFRNPDVKERKQAEFLVHSLVPFRLFERIGVCTAAIQREARRILNAAGHQMSVDIRRDWYF